MLFGEIAPGPKSQLIVVRETQCHFVLPYLKIPPGGKDCLGLWHVGRKLFTVHSNLESRLGVVAAVDDRIADERNDVFDELALVVAVEPRPEFVELLIIAALDESRRDSDDLVINVPAALNLKGDIERAERIFREGQLLCALGELDVARFDEFQWRLPVNSIGGGGEILARERGSPHLNRLTWPDRGVRPERRWVRVVAKKRQITQNGLPAVAPRRRNAFFAILSDADSAGVAAAVAEKRLRGLGADHEAVRNGSQSCGLQALIGASRAAQLAGAEQLVGIAILGRCKLCRMNCTNAALFIGLSMDEAVDGVVNEERGASAARLPRTHDGERPHAA
ncbi:hypothetical protein NLM27_09090 [Bradyrhizobium sp. CCGB12]|uniref:hypothetical protein n=1 Tax=Bradyrhizobium sp. CCGB12 TaxID=2949632 RepID=UPI0020B20879|nr:hypothetical protein [Bradyrhizobium sp. CCGB12]MCP3388928.1 hypothetical protein [Bradyrhizobium sp. CCGB12]